LAQSPKQTGCHQTLPDGSTPAGNRQRLLNQMQTMTDSGVPADQAYFAAAGSWLGDVAPGGLQDYKYFPRGNQDQGNYNYGATGPLFFSSGTLQRAAGAVQIAQNAVDPAHHPYQSSWGTPFSASAPFGDDPDDNSAIVAGTHCP